MGEIIDKTKGKINASCRRLERGQKAQARGREGRTQGQVEGPVKDVKRAVNGRIRN
jgi:hypothetical protein